MFDRIKYGREWRRKRRYEYFKNKSCTKCNSKKRLELDHIDPKKKISHNIWSWSEDRRNKELVKCQILCYKCHKQMYQRQSKDF